MASGDWVPQPHYTGGEPVQFWDGREMIEVRMNSSSVMDAAAAAESLKARFFFRRIAYDAKTMTYTWGAWDRHWVVRQTTHKAQNSEPMKTFKTNDTAPLIMWAAAKGYSD